MLDLRWIRSEPEAFDRALVRRGMAGASSQILSLDGQRRAAQTAFQEVQSRRKDLSKAIGQAKGKGEEKGKGKGEGKGKSKGKGGSTRKKHNQNQRGGRR